MDTCHFLSSFFHTSQDATCDVCVLLRVVCVLLRVVCMFCYMWCVFCYVWCVCSATCGVCVLLIFTISVSILGVLLEGRNLVGYNQEIYDMYN